MDRRCDDQEDNKGDNTECRRNDRLLHAVVFDTQNARVSPDLPQQVGTEFRLTALKEFGNIIRLGPLLYSLEEYQAVLASINVGEIGFEQMEI